MMTDIFITFNAHANAAQAVQMSAYMRNQFAYLGIPTPLRRALAKEFLASEKKKTNIDWDFIDICWGKEEREFQYLALDYLILKKPLLTPRDVPHLKKLALDKSWWDTIDGLDRMVGGIALKYPEVNTVLLEWSVDTDFWLRRIAIDHQLDRKDKTNTVLLEQIIKNNFGQTEFFINKAIGWSLREYSKVNLDWVRNFISRYKKELAPLSIREASKYI
ncbi:MAG: DNA alkylation repair protein [Prevotellaceae bacterium]|jgi:3-methyladenine DNA glycosylase AlkD|nr:DNA alkylation repair protein [Prevotellaceae bacterium]